MGKFFLELALFTGILCQIYMLTSRTEGADLPGSFQQAQESKMLSPGIAAMARGESYTMDPSKVTPAKRNASILHEMAKMEAERIIQTGDYESFHKRIQENDKLVQIIGGQH